MNISAIALAGVQQADARFSNAAARLASIGADSPDGVSPDVVDLSTAVVELQSARNQFDMNLAVVKKANEMEQKVVDLLG